MMMKAHILAALREQFERWEVLLAGLREERINSEQFDLGWSIKDVIAHLWAWQQISIARLEAGLRDKEPEFPKWIVEQEDWEENANQTNAITYEMNHEKPWSEVHHNWRDGFLRFLELGETISERDLLNTSKYSWLSGYSLALILIASYDHHQEHFEKLTNWLEEQ